MHPGQDLQAETDRRPLAAGAATVRAIVLVHWQIRSERENEFMEYWRTAGVIRDRTGLLGEFLSDVAARDPVAAPWITWLLPASDTADGSAVRHFVNVGLWSSETAFLKQVGDDFGDDAPLRPFEMRRRRRLLLRPECWRLGSTPLPTSDSERVR